MPHESTPGTYGIGCKVGPRATLHVFGKVQNFLPVMGIEAQIIQPIF